MQGFSPSAFSSCSVKYSRFIFASSKHTRGSVSAFTVLLFSCFWLNVIADFRTPPFISRHNKAENKAPPSIKVKTEEPPSLPEMTAWSPDDDIPMRQLTNNASPKELTVDGFNYRERYSSKTIITYVCKNMVGCSCKGRT